MSKGSNRRRENTALVEANWPFPERSRKDDQAWLEALRAENLNNAQAGDELVTDAQRIQTWKNAQMGRSSTAEQAPLTRSVVGSNPTAPATYATFHSIGERPDLLELLYSTKPTPYIDDDSGQAVTENWWPGDPLPERE